ncbi:MAG: hypothetical protein HFP76_00470 [Methylococcales symbiont of Iophon sp. n. MRB-2018]|nr:MAG: hypothetical protein HFP76_00470 [Methylococcales symbiont of Iophon sp. n. MRB-2018]
MGVDIPVDAVNSIVHAQGDWEKNCVKRSTKQKLHTRYKIGAFTTPYPFQCLHRNLQKMAKRTRHDKEKSYMEALQGSGNIVAEYGQGEMEGEMEDEVSMNAFLADVMADADLHVEEVDDQCATSSGNAHPLLVLFDCETTGLSIYHDHIIEIAAEVLECPVSYSNATFSSLVKTSRRIPKPGSY